MTRRLLAAAAALLFSAALCAQDAYPSRPISMVVGLPPGGVADLIARPLAFAMEKTLKQRVLVENKPGATGAIGTAAVANARPDGYTTLMALSFISITPEAERLFDRKPPTAMTALRGAVRSAVEDPDFKNAMAKIQTPVSYLDAPEFRKFWDRDAKMLAAAVRRIGRIEDKK